jgi:hypothetical protein
MDEASILVSMGVGKDNLSWMVGLASEMRVVNPRRELRGVTGPGIFSAIDVIDAIRVASGETSPAEYL